MDERWWVALAILWVVFIIFARLVLLKDRREDFTAPLVQREILKVGGLRKFKVILYRKCMRPARFLRRAKVVECIYVTDYVWAKDESYAIKLAQSWQRALEKSCRVEIIDWSYG